MENSGDAVKTTEVGVVEGLCTAQRCISGFIGYPWSKVTLTHDLTWRFGVCQLRIIFHRDAHADGFELHAVQPPPKWHRLYLFGQNREIRISNENLFNNDTRFRG